jgi:hypothetical protein
MAGIKVKKPDGTVVEIDKSTIASLNPDQIAAIMASITSGASIPKTEENSKHQPLTLDQVVSGGKRHKIALFLANQYAVNMKLETNEIHKDWMEIIARDNYALYIDKSNLTQYLTRLAEVDYLEKEKVPGRGVIWTITDRLIAEYPEIPMDNFTSLIENKI